MNLREVKNEITIDEERKKYLEEKFKRIAYGENYRIVVTPDKKELRIPVKVSQEDLIDWLVAVQNVPLNKAMGVMHAMNSLAQNREFTSKINGVAYSKKDRKLYIEDVRATAKAKRDSNTTKSKDDTKSVNDNKSQNAKKTEISKEPSITPSIPEFVIIRRNREQFEQKQNRVEEHDSGTKVIPFTVIKSRSKNQENGQIQEPITPSIQYIERDRQPRSSAKGNEYSNQVKYASKKYTRSPKMKEKISDMLEWIGGLTLVIQEEIDEIRAEKFEKCSSFEYLMKKEFHGKTENRKFLIKCSAVALAASLAVAGLMPTLVEKVNEQNDVIISRPPSFYQDIHINEPDVIPVSTPDATLEPKIEFPDSSSNKSSMVDAFSSANLGYNLRTYLNTTSENVPGTRPAIGNIASYEQMERSIKTCDEDMLLYTPRYAECFTREFIKNWIKDNYGVRGNVKAYYNIENGQYEFSINAESQEKQGEYYSLIPKKTFAKNSQGKLVYTGKGDLGMPIELFESLVFVGEMANYANDSSFDFRRYAQNIGVSNPEEYLQQKCMENMDRLAALSMSKEKDLIQRTDDDGRY